MKLKEIENEIIEISDKINIKIGNAKEISDSVGNYCILTQMLLTEFNDEELYKRGKEKLNNLLTGEISLNDFIELKKKESKKLDELISEVIDKDIDLNNENKKYIINEFKKFISNPN